VNFTEYPRVVALVNRRRWTEGGGGHNNELRAAR